MNRSIVKDKFREANAAVLPILLIVLALFLSIAPVPTAVLCLFLFGAALMIGGIMLFSIGSELSMTVMGKRIGAGITGTRKLWLILSVGFLLGFIVTISEPDLQVLARQVQFIPNLVLILSVAAGVGLFLTLALLRTLLGIPLRTLLIISYGLVFLLAFFAPDNMKAVAFDSGGVTTGPMTVPFILSFGVGVSALRSDKSAASDSFGLIALCSVGPILSVLILSLIYPSEGAGYEAALLPEISSSSELGTLFFRTIPEYLKETAVALLPIFVIFLIFQLTRLRLRRTELSRVFMGILYTYGGLVLFLTGAGAGFMPAGSYLGQVLAAGSVPQLIIPIGMVFGFFIVKAEPAVYVLVKQVEEITNGAVKGRSLRTALSFGVALSIGLSLIRVMTGLPVLWFLIPGYGLAAALSFAVPPLFTSIAFDSGGVASGPMTAGFLLPFAAGASLALGGDVISDAFGVVAMVAMTPLLTIQLMGLLARLRGTLRKTPSVPLPVSSPDEDLAIIDL